jgi:hypothetical protein
MRLAIAHAAGELDHGQLGAQHRPRRLELPDHRGVEVEALLPIRRGAPRGGRGRRGEKILGAVGNAVERPAPAAGGDLALGTPGLSQRVLTHHRDHRVVPGPDPLQPVEIELRQLDGRDLTRPHQLTQLPHRSEQHVGLHDRPSPSPLGGEGRVRGSSLL